MTGAAPGITCEEVSFTVNLSPTDPTDYTVYGDLCTRGTHTNKIVQLLLPGGTYNREYWDSSYQPWIYSYVDKATTFGYSTLNIDKVGSGASDKPPGDQVTHFAHAYEAHQIIQELRAGNVADEVFDKVMIVGHSLGSFAAATLASQYPDDVDGVILTGWAHNLAPDALDIVSRSDIQIERENPLIFSFSLC